MLKGLQKLHHCGAPRRAHPAPALRNRMATQPSADSRLSRHVPERRALWRPALYMPPAVLESRLETIRIERCSVLPLSEALRLLDAGELPERAVSITFDDGFFDFFQHASPLPPSFGFPATVYLTTYYCGRNRPVFDMACPISCGRAELENSPPNGSPAATGRSSDLSLRPQRVAAVSLAEAFHPRGASLDRRGKGPTGGAVSSPASWASITMRFARALQLMRPERGPRPVRARH